MLELLSIMSNNAQSIEEQTTNNHHIYLINTRKTTGDIETALVE